MNAVNYYKKTGSYKYDDCFAFIRQLHTLIEQKEHMDEACYCMASVYESEFHDYQRCMFYLYKAIELNHIPSLVYMARLISTNYSFPKEDKEIPSYVQEMDELQEENRQKNRGTWLKEVEEEDAERDERLSREVEFYYTKAIELGKGKKDQETERYVKSAKRSLMSSSSYKQETDKITQELSSLPVITHDIVKHILVPYLRYV